MHLNWQKKQDGVKQFSQKKTSTWPGYHHDGPFDARLSAL